MHPTDPTDGPGLSGANGATEREGSRRRPGSDRPDRDALERRVARSLIAVAVAASATVLVVALVVLRPPMVQTVVTVVLGVAAVAILLLTLVRMVSSRFQEPETEVTGSIDVVREELALGRVLSGAAARDRAVLERLLMSLEVLRGHLGDAEAIRALDLARRLGRRLERNGRTLNVLAGDDLARDDAQPAEVGAVIAAALVSIDRPDLVDRSSVDEFAIRATAVDDLAHLVAELVDNAIAAAADETKIVVMGRRSGDGYLLSVIDEGVEPDAEEREEANAELAAPTPLSVERPGGFGLAVVARLAARNRIEVRMLEGAIEGAICKVRLPAALAAGVAEAEADQAAAIERAPLLGTDDDWLTVPVRTDVAGAPAVIRLPSS